MNPVPAAKKEMAAAHDQAKTLPNTGTKAERVAQTALAGGALGFLATLTVVQSRRRKKQ